MIKTILLILIPLIGFSQDDHVRFDTLPVIISYSDTTLHTWLYSNNSITIKLSDHEDTIGPKSTNNTYYSESIYWTRGFKIIQTLREDTLAKYDMVSQEGDRYRYYKRLSGYLDQNKNPFPKSIIIWDHK